MILLHMKTGLPHYCKCDSPVVLFAFHLLICTIEQAIVYAVFFPSLPNRNIR